MMQKFSESHPVWFSDVWGVVHDGHKPESSTVEVLKKHRARGGIVILVTNSPRTSEGVAIQLDGIGVAREAYDAIVTSGDVTRALIRIHSGGAAYRLGPQRDQSLFAGLDLKLVEFADAKSVVCTGLFNDETETPEDYEGLLSEMKARRLLMICANPDKIVRIGDRMKYCAGALADAYQKRGGEVLMAGKPFRPIYELAMEVAGKTAGREIDMSEVLAIGDGPDTDIKGAADFGVPAVLLIAGILQAKRDEDVLQDIATRIPHANIVHAVRELSWA
jgi:HAD superfamily hydrolase (TIGR01459 family)